MIIYIYEITKTALDAHCFFLYFFVSLQRHDPLNNTEAVAEINQILLLIIL